MQKNNKKIQYNQKIINKFDEFRNKHMKLSRRVDEKNIVDLLQDYETIIVGSDQIWNPGRREQKEYFLDFGDLFKGNKISYAADSTIAEINTKQINKLKNALNEFKFISVRNEHSHKFVQMITGKDVPIVVDPTLLWNFKSLENKTYSDFFKGEKYILVYTLGKDIYGGNEKAIRKIKEAYGNYLKTYSVVIPTMKFNICNYADKVFYDLGPIEWINMFKNATFVYTDSYHGTLFAIKYQKPFLAYYAEKMRSTRFKDLGKRYKIDKFIVRSVREIDEKNSLKYKPNFQRIRELIEADKNVSITFLQNALAID